MSLASYDPSIVEEVAQTLTLRDPNKRALDALARAIDGAPVGAELVADLATGVGKTYVAAGLLDYLYESGVRNVLVVTPGSTIFRKTLENLRPGSPKYLRGLSCRPVVLTVDNFEAGSVATDLADNTKLKVFVMTVQSLLAPNTKANRRSYLPHESVGVAMVEHMREAGDLVVIADEHHVYFSGKARQFEAAISSLDPAVVVGLTATPHPDTDPDKIVFHYPLAEAIADGYVKIPVLVARPDGLREARAQMADGVALLNAKRAALRAHCKKTHQTMVEPKMLVVAANIAEAGELRDLLVAPDLLGDPAAVLLVTSDEPDETLRLLDEIDEPGSPVRAVVSVSMLKEGWDCKSIYVIASVRTMESQLLTEQILGRGLRLPFGVRLGNTMLDSVEVLSHHRFAELLEQAQVLLTQTLGQRAAEASAVLAEAGTPAPAASAPTWEAVSLPDLLEQVQTTGEVMVTLPGTVVGDDQLGLFGEGEIEAAAGVHEVGGFATIQARLAAAAAATEAITHVYPARASAGRPATLYLPSVSVRTTTPSLSLTRINAVDVEAQGSKFAGEQGQYLRRKAVDVVREEGGRLSVRVEDLDEDQVQAYQPTLPIDLLKQDLVVRLLRSNAVEQTRAEAEAAAQLAAAFLKGAGVTPDTAWQAQHAKLATEALVNWLKGEQAKLPVHTETVVELQRYPEPPERTLPTLPRPHHSVSGRANFVPHQWYSGWRKSLFEVSAFDAWSSEFRLAILLDLDRDVSMWLRLSSDVPLSIAYRHRGAPRTYYPDFLVVDRDGVHWVVEAKADSEMDDPVVLAKQDAARRWVTDVNGSGKAPNRWAYLLVSESTIGVAGSWAQVRDAGFAFRG